MANTMVSVFDDIVARIRATNLFDAVDWGTMSVQINQNAISYAIVYRTRFDYPDRGQSSTIDDYLTQYIVKIRYIDQNPVRLRERYMSMEAATFNALHKRPLGGAGVTLPEMNEVLGAIDERNPPANEYIGYLQGRFRFAVPTEGLETGTLGYGDAGYDPGIPYGDQALDVGMVV